MLILEYNLMLIPWILTLAIIAGQIIKLPLLPQAGVTILDITVIILGLLGLFKLKFKLKKPPLFLKSAMVFILVAIISLVLTPLHLQTSQYLTSFLYILRFSAYILLGWILYSEAFASLTEKTFQVFFFSGSILAILGLLQLIFIPDLRFLTAEGWDPHYFRTVSTFLDPNFLGGFFTLILILLISHLRGGNILTPRVLIVILLYLALLTTFSRGAYLTFFTGFLTLSFLNKSIKLAMLTIVLFAGLLYGYYNYQRSIAVPRNINRTQSAEFRLNTWQQGLTLFQQFPILGVGFNSYRYALKAYHLGSEDFLRTHGSSTNDSSILFVASTTGVVGLTAYLFFLATLLKTAWQKHLQENKWGQICIAGILASLVQSFFANSLFYPFILIWIILVSAKLSK